MSRPQQIAHESLTADTIEIGSDRSFGFVMAAVGGILALASWYKEIATLPAVLAGLATLLLLVAWLTPQILHPANVLWMKFAYLLHRIISPLILALLFYGAFTPTALWIKLSGKDPLRLKPDPDANSYWIDCSQETSDLKKQF